MESTPGDEYMGSPEGLKKAAEEGRLPKRVLASFLSIEQRPRYLDACAVIEKQYTDNCVAQNDPCLESGCAVEGEGEICLQPLLRAEVDYHKACGAEWVTLFANVAHRIEAWKR